MTVVTPTPRVVRQEGKTGLSFKHTLSYIWTCKPLSVLLENVVGLLQKPKDGGLSDAEYLTDVMSEHGYRSSWITSQAPHRTGVPWYLPSVLRSHNVLCGRTPHAPSA